MEKQLSVFATLSVISVKDKIERKGNLDYLSWANAWSMLKTLYPDAQRKVYEHDHTGFNYFTDGRTAWVKVGIIVNNVEHIDYLPIMDYRNNAIPVEKISAMDVNKAIQRSTAKAIAMHGLGLSLWTGEDVPELVTATEKQSQPEEKNEELVKGTESWERAKAYIVANKEQGLESILTQLKRKYTVNSATVKEIKSLLK